MPRKHDENDEDYDFSSSKKKEEKKVKLVDTGPPPDFKKRHLIFDSLTKIISRDYSKNRKSTVNTGDSRGTYVYTWGAGYHGQLGQKFVRGVKKYATKPRLVEMVTAIRQVSCGGLHTAAVTDSGAVMTWGDARSFQLGYQPHGFTNQAEPRIVEEIQMSHFIVQVACGQNHTVALSDKGHMLSWGLSWGHGDRQPVKTPKRIATQPNNVNFVDISCGDRHTVGVTNQGKVYSFGCGEHGQLGHADENDKLRPALVEALNDVHITSVVCGSIHTCFVTNMGELYVCGFGEHFYPDDEQNFFYLPVKIPFKERLIQVACGQSHILALNDKGDVFTWGCGTYGQLGHGVKGNLNRPRPVLAGKSIAQVAAGRYHSLALTSFGVLYSWGCGENGQLGHNNDDNVLFPRIIEPNLGTVVGQIACGEHHTAVLTSTPWNKIDPEVSDWVVIEREEYSKKLSWAKSTNHGLFKQDLVRLQEEMEKLKMEMAADKRSATIAEEEDKRRNIESVTNRERIEQELAKEGNAKPGASTKADREEDKERESAAPIDSGRRSKKVEKKKATRMAGLGVSPRGGQSSATEDSFETAMNQTARPQTARAGGAEEPRGVPSHESKLARANFLKESSAMVNRMKSIIADTGDSSSENRLKKMQTLVFDFRKEYDTLKAITTKRMKILLEDKQSARALKKGNEAIEDIKKAHNTRKQALEMKLNTVTIKITETEENRKNYALNIVHLKEEEYDHHNELEALRKQCAGFEAFCKKMNERKLQFLEEQNGAEAELSAFQAEIQQFQTFISEQLEKFKSISTVARQRREKREMEKEARAQKVQEKIAARVLKLNNEMEEKNKEAFAMAQQLESVNERLRYFEKRFQQIASATGLTNPDAIINKFALKEEIKVELETERNTKKSQIQELKQYESALLADLTSAKDQFIQSQWKDVDAIQTRLTHSEANLQRYTKQAEGLEQMLAYFYEGLLALDSAIPGDLTGQAGQVSYEGREQYSHDKVRETLGGLQDKLVVLVDAVNRGEDRKRQGLNKRFGDTKNNSIFAFSSSMQQE
mmetsp:Transcript_2410/g.4500  ORF Transcript_2410/g.4500 Transcript_2410/m.4500 type:complete len:1051 (+) Transcript_2410:95-3247(+)|eukprot:CAMPEP_0175137704 /NCGR_PEP_ID=MMETSP0087-20121206/9954_1 /TAXON_ID=136419 /ORGANISM="Unknown Unknown, Strain D1" /LENGTH=1050 /DNA_ID=CAMNT_0016420551 /DNA_START=75 /DNA_END=3227 /DNA_ORIENTATION=-